MKKENIKDIVTADLEERLETEITSYEQLVINHSVAPIENPARIKQQRRVIARIKTELNKRYLNA